MNEYLQYKKSLAKFNPENYGLATIDLNPTELCNRLCHFCPRSSFYPSLNLNMSMTYFHLDIVIYDIVIPIIILTVFMIDTKPEV